MRKGDEETVSMRKRRKGKIKKGREEGESRKRGIERIRKRVKEEQMNRRKERINEGESK